MNKKTDNRLLNYTTEIEPIKTASEIMAPLLFDDVKPETREGKA